MAIKSVKVTKPGAVGAYKNPAPYASTYQPQLDTALNNVVNFNYDPMQDASFRQLANLYDSKGNQAAKNALGDAAMLNGGYGTSYALSASQQVRNDYNQQLAAMIPELEDKAYSRAQGTLSALRDADNSNYNRYRDTIADNQWQYTTNYNAYRDKMSDYQWGLGYNMDVYNLKKSKASGGGGGGRSRGGGGGYGGSGGYGGAATGGDSPNLYNLGLSIDRFKKGINAGAKGITSTAKKKSTKK